MKVPKWLWTRISRRIKRGEFYFEPGETPSWLDMNDVTQFLMDVQIGHRSCRRAAEIIVDAVKGFDAAYTDISRKARAHGVDVTKVLLKDGTCCWLDEAGPFEWAVTGGSDWKEGDKVVVRLPDGTFELDAVCWGNGVGPKFLSLGRGTFDRETLKYVGDEKTEIVFRGKAHECHSFIADNAKAGRIAEGVSDQ